MAGLDLGHQNGDEIDVAQIVEIEKPGPQAVVEVVRIIGDIVGDRRRLRLEARIGCKLEAPARVIFEDRRRHAAQSIAAERPAVLAEERTIVLDEPFERFPDEIEPVEIGIAALELGHDAQRLRIVVEAAEGRHAGFEDVFARMSERRVAEIVGERQSLGQIVVEPERAGERAGDLGHLDRMRQPGPVMIALVRHEDLRLVGEAPECGRMDDTVAVALEFRPRRRRRFGKEPAATLPGVGGTGGPHEGHGLHGSHLPARSADARLH